MRRMFSVGLAAALALCVAGTASSSTTIDLIFTSGSGTSVTVLGGPGTVTLDVFMTTTDGLEIFSTTVFWDNATTSAIAGTVEWFGKFIPPTGPFFSPINPGPAGVFIDNTALQVNSFDGAFLGGVLPSGTYHLGTIVYQASAVGTTNIISGIIAGLDGFASVAAGVIDGTVTFNGATINVVPEPATASLLGLGLVGLILAGRRKRA